MNLIQKLIATWFFSGYAPFASGTVGTFASLPLVVLLWWRGSDLWHLIAIAVLLGLGVWAAGPAESEYGRKDPGQVVIDETIGLLVATVAVPASWINLVAAFLLFRVMDIVKPWPARRLERLPGAWGIIVDDMVAGLYANLALQLLIYLMRGTP